MSTTRAVVTNLRASVMADAEYRASLLINLWMTLARAVVAVGMIHIVFEQAPEINGWNRYQVAMVYGMFMSAGGIAACIIFPSLTALTENIRKGTLDFSLTKPADAQIVEATQRFDIAELIPTAAGAVMIAVSAHYAQVDIGFMTILTLATVLLAGFAILYAFHMLVATTAFWFVKLDMLMDQLHEMFSITRWPTSIYPPWMSLAISMLLPPAIAVTVPVEVLVGRADGVTITYTIVTAVTLAVAARSFWTFAVRRYSGASA